MSRSLSISVPTECWNLKQGWTHHIIQSLFDSGKSDHDIEKWDFWYILPTPNGVVRGLDVECKAKSHIITALLPASYNMSLAEFSKDLYLHKRGKIRHVDYIKTLFVNHVGDKQIRVFGRYEWLIINFSQSPSDSSTRFPISGLKEPPSWASTFVVQAICKCLQHEVFDKRKPSKVSSISLEESEIGLEVGLNISIVSPENKNENESQINCVSDHVNVAIISPQSIDDVDFHNSDNFDHDLTPPPPSSSSISSSCISLEHFPAGSSTPPYQHLDYASYGMDSVDDDVFIAEFQRRLQTNRAMLKYIGDSVLMGELLRRGNIQDRTVLYAVSRCRVHFPQTLEDMSHNYLYHCRKVVGTCCQALTNILCPKVGLEILNQVKDESDQYKSHILYVLNSIKGLDSRVRRPQMSYFPKYFRRRQVQDLMQESISRKEWHLAQIHSMYPGVGMPIEKSMHRRCRATDAQIEGFFDLFSEDILQRCAFGTKTFKSIEGKATQHERVYTNRNIASLWRQYFEERVEKVLSTFMSEGEEQVSRCKKLSKTGQQCFHLEGHVSKCKFTPDSAFGKNSFRAFMKCITAGHITSLAGLDIEDVEKGRENFERLSAMASRLCLLTDTDPKAILEKISRAETFHSCNFVSHIKLAAANHEEGLKYKCCCLDCGFAKDEDEGCANKNSHQGVCSCCAEAFAIFIDIKSMIDKVKENGVIASNAISEEISSYEFFEPLCRQNLIDYRAHLVLKYDEKEADKEELRNLKYNQAIVVSDWKMKILQLFHRETQEKFFGKRGTSMIGFMIISHQQNHERSVMVKKDVDFHFFLTDDTTQDNTSVNAAKRELYENCLPAHVDEVRFRADGAGCFSCNLTKAAMCFWHK